MLRITYDISKNNSKIDFLIKAIDIKSFNRIFGLWKGENEDWNPALQMIGEICSMIFENVKEKKLFVEMDGIFTEEELRKLKNANVSGKVYSSSWQGWLEHKQIKDLQKVIFNQSNKWKVVLSLDENSSNPRISIHDHCIISGSIEVKEKEFVKSLEDIAEKYNAEIRRTNRQST